MVEKINPTTELVAGVFQDGATFYREIGEPAVIASYSELFVEAARRRFAIEHPECFKQQPPERAAAVDTFNLKIGERQRVCMIEGLRHVRSQQLVGAEDIGEVAELLDMLENMPDAERSAPGVLHSFVD